MSAARRVPRPCSDWEDACLAEAWGLGSDPGWEAHRRSCPHCLEASKATSEFAERCSASEAPREDLRRFSEEVFLKTSRRAESRRGLVWAGAGLAAALSTIAAFAVVWRALPKKGVGDVAQMDPALLKDMELAENLDVLEVLDALEEIEDA